MAFTTTRGESGVDFIGTDGVDALFALNESGTKNIDAKGGNDNVDLFDESGVVGTAEVKLGAGADTFTMGVNSTVTNRLSSSTVNGGPGNDNISTEGAVSTKIRGNEDNDDFFLVSNYTDTTINGNAGVDSFTISDGVNSGATATDSVTLSNTKILGGSGNDGQMDFDGNENGVEATSLLAVDSVIQGGKGLDTITIGDVLAGSSGFRVSGGADNDTITVNNGVAESDGVAYNGAAGDDSITFTAASAADASTKAGEGNDVVTINGNGDIDAYGEAGNDSFTLAGGGKHTVTGGMGADSYSSTVTDELTIKIGSVSESAAATSGTTVTFDTIATALTADDIIDASTAGVELVGNRLNGTAVGVSGAALTTTVAVAADIIRVAGATESFTALKTALDAAPLTASISNLGGANVNTGRISAQLVQVASTGAGAIDGYYAILNNTNTILDSGDVMFELTAATDAAALTSFNAMVVALEAGF